MKKFLVFLIGLILIQNCADARDYTKLQMKEAKHAQKYGTTKKIFDNYTENLSYTQKRNVKDPQIMQLSAVKYKIIDDSKYNSKLKSDEAEYQTYEKNLKKVTFLNYNAQAKGSDYMRVYRIAERIIRANRLDYMTWRIGIKRDATEFNAMNTAGNYIELNSSVIDTFIDNDDALAMIIGHEMGHALLGHSQRNAPAIAKMNKIRSMAKEGDPTALTIYAALKRKYLIDSKNMEYSADIEGAKLAMKAGFNINRCSDVITFLETLPHSKDIYSTHPNPNKRLESFNQNRKYFPETIWKNIGRYNIYNTKVLKVSQSSDRRSIVISQTTGGSPADYYRPETMEEMYARFGYTSYLNNEYEKSLNYFEKLFEITNNNASAYLYASYSAEELYNKHHNNKYKNLSKEYAQKALELEPDNKYMKEQAEAL